MMTIGTIVDVNGFTCNCKIVEFRTIEIDGVMKTFYAASHEQFGKLWRTVEHFRNIRFPKTDLVGATVTVKGDQNAKPERVSVTISN